MGISLVLMPTIDLAQDGAGVVIKGGHQTHSGALSVFGSADFLAIDRDHLRRRLCGDPGTDQCVENIPVDPRQGAPDGGRIRDTDSELPQRCGGRIGSPFSDRGEGTGAGKNSADGDHEDPGEMVADSASVAGIRDAGQSIPQGRRTRSHGSANRVATVNKGKDGRR